VVAQIKALGRKAAALPLNAADTDSFDTFCGLLASVLKNTFDAEHFDFLITMLVRRRIHLILLTALPNLNLMKCITFTSKEYSF
jgi:hypothetical protein